MEASNILESLINVKSSEPQHVSVITKTKHVQTLEKLLEKAKNDVNILGYLVFGSVAAGTYDEKSDIDVITVYRSHKPASGINKIMFDGLVVDSLFITYESFARSVREVPYLMYTMGKAKLLFDREKSIWPLLQDINNYFAENSEIVDEWNFFINQSKEVKLKTGCRASSNGNTIIDVWNELEKRYSGGKIRRSFFNSFYFTNSIMFSLVKGLLKLTERGDR